MLILDTDHLSALQRGGIMGTQLEERLMQAHNELVATSIVTVEEQIKGWFAEISRAKNVMTQVPYYSELDKLLRFFTLWTVASFDNEAAQIFVRLKSQPEVNKLGAMDLKIAAIVLANNATLLSANLRHFRLVPNLRVEDWLTG